MDWLSSSGRIDTFRYVRVTRGSWQEAEELHGITGGELERLSLIHISGSSDERESAEADYLAAVEEWELAKYKRLYDASKTRLRRMREKTGTNPRKGTRRPEGEEIQ